MRFQNLNTQSGLRLRGAVSILTISAILGGCSFMESDDGATANTADATAKDAGTLDARSTTTKTPVTTLTTNRTTTTTPTSTTTTRPASTTANSTATAPAPTAASPAASPVPAPAAAAATPAATPTATPAATPAASPAPTPAATPAAAATSTASAPTINDPRVKWWIDPRNSFASISQTALLQTNTTPFSLYTVQSLSEPGQYGEDGQLRFGKEADPLDSTHRAFAHRLNSSYSRFTIIPIQGASYYSNLSYVTGPWDASGASPMQEEPVWIAFSIKFNSDMFGHNGDSLAFMELHNVPDSYDSEPMAHFAMLAGQNDIQIISRSNPNSAGTQASRTDRTLFSESNPSTTQWHHFVIQANFTSNSSRNPYIRIWRKLGNGAPVQIVNSTAINAYNDQAKYMPPYFGMYMWNANGMGNKSTRTLFSKGMYILRDAAGSTPLSQESMFALLGGV